MASHSFDIGVRDENDDPAKDVDETYSDENDDDYAHSDDNSDYKKSGDGNKDGDEATQKSGETDRKVREAEDYAMTKRSGTLFITLVGPSRESRRVSGDVSITGEEGRAEEESIGCGHPSFELYWKKEKFEDTLYFDCEADPKYHHVHPGTLTVQGYTKECWEYEERRGTGEASVEGKFITNADPLPGLSVTQLLRRLDELQTGTRPFGEDPELDKADLIEFVGETALGNEYEDIDVCTTLITLFSALNRREAFADFTTRQSIGQEWNSMEETGVLGMWNFVLQMIITAEIARRLDSGEVKDGLNRLTLPALASLIVCDLWLQNVEMDMTNSLPKPAATELSAEEHAGAEVIYQLGEEFLDRNAPDVAASVLANAVAIDPANMDYRSKRCQALIKAAEQNKEQLGDEQSAKRLYREAVEEGKLMTQYAPDEWQSWGFYAKALLGRGTIKKALKAYECALSFATAADEKEILGECVVDARMALAQEFLAMALEKDKLKGYALQKLIKQSEFDFLGNALEWHSKVHKRQEEGLIVFAESIKWPYVEETRERVARVYECFHADDDENMPAILNDWLYGLILPGKWFAYNIMTSLVHCTPSLSSVGPSLYDDCGLALPDTTYWRTQTVLGRVLGAIPGVGSLNGWIGPCLPVELAENKVRWVNVIAEPVLPRIRHIDVGDGPLAFFEDEDLDSYVADIKDPKKWTIPSPPSRDECYYTVKSIRLMPEEADEDEDDEFNIRCHASITFEVNNNNKDSVEVQLRTKPTFVVPPRCHPSDHAGHPVHARELSEYQVKTRTPDKLVDDDEFNAASVGDAVLVINATADGAETMARAVCALRGLNAVIRTSGGLCFACALKAAKGLNVDGLIWCD